MKTHEGIPKDVIIVIIISAVISFYTVATGWPGKGEGNTALIGKEKDK